MMIIVALLWRADVFLPVKPFFHKTYYQKVTHFLLWIILPLASILCVKLYEVEVESVPERQHEVLDIRYKYSKTKYGLILYDCSLTGGLFIAFALNVPTECGYVVMCFIFYNWPLEVVFHDLLKKALPSTKHIIQTNIIKLRLIAFVPFVLLFLPMTLTFVVYLLLGNVLNDSIRRWIISLTMPLLLLYAVIAPLFSIYQVYGTKKRRHKSRAVVNVSANPTKFVFKS
uniref:G_PROTEIN_RECEP_F1_2 domain-containing protein n=1 Tax=Rhabditophanes sp. KR3021 TaxID=114890 RepID=A0AC35TP73_9BILA